MQSIEEAIAQINPHDPHQVDESLFRMILAYMDLLEKTDDGSGEPLFAAQSFGYNNVAGQHATVGVFYILSSLQLDIPLLNGLVEECAEVHKMLLDRPKTDFAIRSEGFKFEHEGRSRTLKVLIE
jgi:hypothetical protein